VISANRSPRPELIPAHLRGFVAEQDPTLYTPVDHACWRYILRVSRRFFAEHAHPKYLDGLRATGIGTERIPLVAEMDASLRRFGWGAVPVVGFIPPAAFFEFLSLGMLPIACDMRRLEHVGYTPAPDIVHEAAGHAPIIADPQYADYLRRYGELARKVVFSARDQATYEAVRRLSDLKEDPGAPPDAIARAQSDLDRLSADESNPSEAAWLARMAWWTIEYGLVGDLKSPRIYGAGLLSSVSESHRCLGPDVRRIPFSMDCIGQSYDITRPQPQLFVTPDFPTLSAALEDLASRMAFRRGGFFGLERARAAGTVTTAVMDTALQVSGVLDRIDLDASGSPCLVRYRGPCQLSFADEELPGHGADAHREGFCAPLGRAAFSPGAIRRTGGIDFPSGVTLRGELERVLERGGRPVVVGFARCSVTGRDGECLWRPEWGGFDLACGERVVSVFGGAADRAAYLQSGAVGGLGQTPSKQKSNLTPASGALAALYGKVRDIREGPNRRGTAGESAGALESIRSVLAREYPEDWLLRLELLELAPSFAAELRDDLARIAADSAETGEMIRRGLELVDAPARA